MFRYCLLGEIHDIEHDIRECCGAGLLDEIRRCGLRIMVVRLPGYFRV